MVTSTVVCANVVKTSRVVSDSRRPIGCAHLRKIEAEFLGALARVHDAGRQDALSIILKPLLQDASFQRIGLTALYAHQDTRRNAELFRRLSSGHKVVLKIVTELTAYMGDDKPTLVLIDEPETHLHPPLLAALLKSVRACLDQFDGYAILATHSPVVLQETPSRYVNVLRRMGDQSRVVTTIDRNFRRKHRSNHSGRIQSR